jgi:hypothetical protein
VSVVLILYVFFLPRLCTFFIGCAYIPFDRTDGAISSPVLALIFKLLVSHLQLLCMNLGSRVGHSWVYTHIVQFTLMHSTRCLLI